MAAVGRTVSPPVKLHFAAKQQQTKRDPKLTVDPLQVNWKTEFVASSKLLLMPSVKVKAMIHSLLPYLFITQRKATTADRRLASRRQKESEQLIM